MTTTTYQQQPAAPPAVSARRMAIPFYEQLVKDKAMLITCLKSQLVRIL